MVDSTKNKAMTQNLFGPALQLGRDAEALFVEGKFVQVGGVLHIADLWLQFLLHGTCDLAADAAREQSLAKPDERPLLGQALTFTRIGISLLENDPRQAEAALKIAAFYHKCAVNWEPAADDGETREKFAKFQAVIEKRAEQARCAVAARPAAQE